MAQSKVSDNHKNHHWKYNLKNSSYHPMVTIAFAPLTTSLLPRTELLLHQFRIVIIPERHSARIKWRLQLGTCVHFKVSSVSRVVFLPRDTADWRIAGPGKVCVHGHNKQTDNSVTGTIKWQKHWNQRNSEIKGNIFTMDHAHPGTALTVLLMARETASEHIRS